MQNQFFFRSSIYFLTPPPGASTIIYDDDSVIGDWESDRTVLSGRSSIRGRDSDATESERLRVVDIIRKLTPNEAGPSSSPPRSRSSFDLPPPVPGPRLRTSLDHSCGPRIRGRQAYIDLLMQAERDRRNELQRLVSRKPVSTFSHRGRIQAALKIKLLRRGMETKDSHRHFRERVSTKHPNAPMHSRSSSRDSIPNSNSLHLDHNGPNTTHSQDCIPAFKQPEIHHTCFQEFQTPFVRQENQCAETEAAKSLNPNEIKQDEEEVGKAADYEGNHDIVETETAAFWASDASHTEEGWEEFHYDDYQANEASNTDWIEMVSRPRSDWEYLRQERYQEMLDPFLDNDDIRQLLGRKSVSSFLSCGMRDKIDQLMISRTQGKPVITNNQRQDKKQEKQIPEKGRVVAWGAAGEDEECFHEYEEAESSQHYTECDDFADSTSASWSHNQNQNQNQGGHELSESSYQAASPSARHRDINGRNSSFTAHPSLEMDLIYDLRRHMEQLHQEISELRKSIQCSNDMQMKMHRSIKKELNHHSDAKSGRRLPLRKTNGRRCCVCSKVQVDCVLYKCGHMCTCFMCAHQLHWNSGSCPICRAQIVDVIRTLSSW